MDKLNVFHLNLICIVIFLNSCVGSNENSTPIEPSIISKDISNQQITSFAEDNYGYVWIGTNRGLNRFNGYDFHHYFHSTGNGLSICNNQINTLHIDTSNTLWIGTKKGISRYQIKNDFFETIPVFGSNKAIIDIHETKNGQLFANTSNAVYRFDQTRNAFVLALHFDNPNINNRFHIGASNNLWLTSRSGVSNYSSKDFTLTRSLPVLKEPNLFFSGTLNDTNLWVVHGKGNLRVIDTYKGTQKDVFPTISEHPILSKALITNIFQVDKNSYLVVTHKNGSFLYNKTTGNLIHEMDQEFPFMTPDGEITTLFKDSQGNLWFGTHEHGVFPSFKYKNQFNKYRPLSILTKGKSVKAVRVDQSSRVWINTYSDLLIIYDLTTENTDIINLKTFFPEDPYYQDKIKDILITKEYIWLVSLSKAVKCTYTGHKLIRKKNYQLKTALGHATNDNLGNIWIVSDREFVFCINELSDSISTVVLFPPRIDRENSILRLSDGKIVVAASDQPLKVINPADKTFKDIHLFEKKDNVRFEPTTLYEDSKGNIWIGLLDNKMLKYNPSTQKVDEIENTKEVVSIIESDDGNLWFGSLWGLHNYDTKNNELHSYFSYDGIGGNQFNSKSVCKLESGSLLFGGTHGLTTFDPSEISLNRNIPLYFEDLSVNNKPVKPGHEIEENLKSSSQIRLNYNQNAFSISYAALDYSEYNRLRYYYQLEGYDNRWIDAQNNRIAHYSNIKPGKYLFRVKATSNDSNNTESENSIPVIISQPPWFSAWAIFLYIGMSALVGYYIYKLYTGVRLNKMRAMAAMRDKEQEALVNQMNMSFFSNISHEFRTPLSLITGPVSSLTRNDNLSSADKTLLELIQRNIKRMLRLVNQLMDLSKLESDTLKLKVARIDAIYQINSIIELYRISAREKNITLKTVGLEDSYFMMMDVDKLEKIITNLLSNAFKYTPEGGSITINFDIVTRLELASTFPNLETPYQGYFAIVHISDTGPGIPENKLEDIFKRYYQIDDKHNATYNWGTGIGLYYTRRLVEIHHGLIKASNNKTGGSCFTFIIPTHKSAYGDQVISEKQDLTIPEKTDETEIPHSIKVGTIDAENEASSPQCTILVVDDDIEIAYFIKKLLSPTYQVVTKYEGKSAWNALPEINPDLIVSDVLMPGMNGYEFCQMVKDNIDYCHIPVILLTAKTLLGEQVEGLETGANAYVTKPFEPEYLIALIKSQLRNKTLLGKILTTKTDTGNVEGELLTPKDKAFMNQLYEIMENELNNPDINISVIAEKMRMSRTKFYHKIKGLTSEKPNIFFRKYKLNKAAELLTGGKYNVSEVAEMTGFINHSHFTSVFKKQFNCIPSDYKGL
jgi:signal transduction histidine kinase/DNA-binding response OmpR family regulator/ligand-binding sensor domain-containing protein